MFALHRDSHAMHVARDENKKRNDDDVLIYNIRRTLCVCLGRYPRGEISRKKLKKNALTPIYT